MWRKKDNNRPCVSIEVDWTDILLVFFSLSWIRYPCCHGSDIFIAMNAISLLPWKLHSYCHECDIFIVMNAISLLPWKWHCYCHECDIFIAINVISLLPWKIHFYCHGRHNVDCAKNTTAKWLSHCDGRGIHIKIEMICTLWLKWRFVCHLQLQWRIYSDESNSCWFKCNYHDNESNITIAIGVTSSLQWFSAGPLVQWLKLPAWKIWDRGFEPHSDIKFQRIKMFLPCLLVKIEYCGEPPWPRGSVLGLRPLELEFRTMCLDGSVISFISPFSGGSSGPV